MSGGEVIHTQFLVLRKTAYMETSLILAGISPDQGQVHFMVQGARKLSKKHFPLADLFRVLGVQYRAGNKDLHRWMSADLTADYTNLAHDPVTYECAVWLAKFALANSPEHVPQPNAFKAMTIALERLAKAANTEYARAVMHAARIGTGLVFLAENGMLPSYADDPNREKYLTMLLDMAQGLRQVPLLKPEVWEQLDHWLLALLHHADYRAP